MEIRSLYNNKNISLGLTTQEIEELLVNKELSSKSQDITIKVSNSISYKIFNAFPDRKYYFEITELVLKETKSLKSVPNLGVENISLNYFNGRLVLYHRTF